MIFAIILAIGGGFFVLKTGRILNKISSGGIFETLLHNIPGVRDELKGEKEGRINIALLGMRGKNLPGGGNLADTIIIASISPVEGKVAMISVPRDLYVTVPDTQDKQKINAVHFYGEEKGDGKGLDYMEEILEEVSGLPIHYAARINFDGFKQLIDALDGIEITLDNYFEEPVQFNEPHVCDGQVFTLPTGEYENKTAKVYNPNGTVKRERIIKQYPLCTNPNTECGGNFKLPAGKQTLNGENALCYVRSRATSNDFERAKRQQQVIKLIKEKMLSAGTLTDFSKINGILDSLGDNMKTDMALWEVQRLYEIYKEIPNAQIYQRVLENSEEGLLYNPEESNGAGYILLPRGNNYDRIHELAQSIFSAPDQSDIKPK
jgi:LCP family protein required for cell wall assembly